MSLGRVEPDWNGAALALLSGCVDLGEEAQRLALLEQVCRGLGDALYPDFLNLLAVIGERGDAQACAVLAATLLAGLQSGRLPTGRRQAWGSAMGRPAAAQFGAWRTLGPLEFLCASQDRTARPDATVGLSEAEFLRQGQALLRLLNSSAGAQALYIQRLRALAADPVEGGLSRSARQAMDRMADAWAQGLAPDLVCQRYLAAMQPARGHGLSALAQQGMR